MAHTLVINDGVTSVDLAVSAATGIALQHGLQLPTLNEQYARVGPMPGVDGQRTVASALADRTIDIPFIIYGTSVDNVDSQLRTLTLLLRSAVRWAMDRTTQPARLEFKRQGTTNTAVAIIKAVVAMPTPAGPEDWLDTDTATNQLHMRMTLVIEPVWHAGTLSTICSATALTMTPGSNYCPVTAVPTGDMTGPLALTLARTSANAWADVWILLHRGYDLLTNLTGTADANAHGGSAQSVAVTGTAAYVDGPNATLASTFTNRMRHFARIKVTAGTAGKLQLQSRVTVPGSVTIDLPWVTFAGTSGNWLLVDLGSHAPPTNYLNRILMDTSLSQVSFDLGLKSSDASSVTALVDYIQAVDYYSMVRLRASSNILGNGDKLTYEAIGFIYSTFYYPRAIPQVYQTTSANVLEAHWSRYGTLGGAYVDLAPSFWVHGQSLTTHTLGDTTTIEVKHLPSYSHPLRGAA